MKYAVGSRACELDLVAHHHHRHAGLAQLAHHLEHAADQLGIERAGRLVEQQDARLERERAGDRDALLLTAGQLVRVRLGFFAKPYPCQRLQPERFCLWSCLSDDFSQSQSDIAQCIEMRIQVELLEHHADLLAHAVDVHVGPSNVGAVDHHRAAGGLLEPVAATQQRRLAGARGPDDEDELALRDDKVDPLQHLEGAEGFMQFPNF
jgi:hypothetical protein